MTLVELAKTRITPKFVNGTNFNNLLEFLIEIYDNTTVDISLIKDLKNTGSTYSLVLDELGKFLGVYPRPKYKDVGVDFRELNDTEYARLLKAVSSLTKVNGTIEDWIQFYTDISGGVGVIVNKPSSYDIIIKKDLTQFEKNLVEYLSDLNNLTVSRSFLGTTNGVQPFQYGVAGYDIAPYVQSW